MSSILTGINTGVIRHDSQFVALALKVNQPHEQSLLLIPALLLRDLFICLEYRLYLQHQRTTHEKAAFKKQQDIATAAMHQHIPPLTQNDLQQSDIRQRVINIEPQNKHKNILELSLTLHGGNTVSLRIEDAQIALIVSAITHAIRNAGMHELSLRLSSLLDFLPLYDADMKPGGQLEYDTYTHPAWKEELFSETLALVYHYVDEKGEPCACGTVVKSRHRGENADTQAIARRLLAFSPRLKKLKGKACQVSVSTLVAGVGQVPKEQCLRTLHALHQKSTAKA